MSIFGTNQFKTTGVPLAIEATITTTKCLRYFSLCYYMVEIKLGTVKNCTFSGTNEFKQPAVFVAPILAGLKRSTVQYVSVFGDKQIRTT